MSQHGPNFDRAQRNYDAMTPHDDTDPDLEGALPCPCGSNAASIGARTPNARLTCGNRRCGRQTPPGLTLEDAIAAWNESVEADQ